MSSIRVVVKIPTSIYPELVADLSNVQLRDRAERLWILALLEMYKDCRHHRSENLQHLKTCQNRIKGQRRPS